MSLFIHKTAIVDEPSRIGKNTKIWHWTHVCSGAKIGSNCSLGQNVYVASNASIGNLVKIQNNVSVYDNVILEDNVFCGPSVVFTNVMNPRSQVVRKSEYQTTLVRKGATLGANSTIICGNEIGEYAFIAAGAVVTSNVKPYALMAGVPAKQIGWWSEWGERIPLDLSGSGCWLCSHTSRMYNLVDDKMQVSSDS